MIPKTVTMKCLAKLKDQLKEKRVTYKALAEALDISEVSVKRLLNHHTITLERLLEIAQILEIDAAELLASAQSKPELTFFTEEQDAAFYGYPHLHAYFEQLFTKKKSPKVIEKEFGLNAASTHLYLRKLETLDLLTIGSNQNVSFRVSEPIGFSSKSRVIRANIKSAIIATCDRVLDQQADGDMMLVRELNLDNAIYGQLMKELSQVIGRYSELSHQGANSHSNVYRVALFSHPIGTANLENPVTPINTAGFE